VSWGTSRSHSWRAGSGGPGDGFASPTATWSASEVTRASKAKALAAVKERAAERVSEKATGRVRTSMTVSALADAIDDIGRVHRTQAVRSLKVLRGMLDFAIRYGAIPFNPADAVRRTLLLPPFAVQALRTRLPRAAGPESPVFATRTGEHMTPHQFRPQLGVVLAATVLGHAGTAVTSAHFIEKRRDAATSSAPNTRHERHAREQRLAECRRRRPLRRPNIHHDARRRTSSPAGRRTRCPNRPGHSRPATASSSPPLLLASVPAPAAPCRSSATPGQAVNDRGAARLLLVVGWPGAGKTTLARHLPRSPGPFGCARTSGSTPSASTRTTPTSGHDSKPSPLAVD
jgi:hypothetical protein